MANVVTKAGLAELSQEAESLGMAVLFESHQREEIRKLPSNARICGINSRRFMAGKFKSTRLDYFLSRCLGRDLSIDTGHFKLVDALPPGTIKVAESGVDPRMVPELRDTLGFNSILVGTSLLNCEQGVAYALNEFEREIAAESVGVSSRHSGVLQHAAV
jgi:indole-3-glycerol phosphate synthase